MELLTNDPGVLRAIRNYYGVKCDCRDKKLEQHLHVAAFDGMEEKVCALLGRVVDPNAPDENGMTPLHDAALNGHVGIVRILLDAGADVNALTRNNLMALHFAAYKLHYEIMHLLLTAGADPEIKAKNGMTAYALEKSQQGIQQAMEYFPRLLNWLNQGRNENE